MTRSNLDDNETNVTVWGDVPDATLNNGATITVTDVAGSPIMMVSNGSEWVPVNGQCALAISGIGYGIMPSGTIATGASGHFTSGTTLPHTYSEGLWMYIVSAGTTPALPAGFYWCVFSTTAICTIYTNGPGSAAYNFTVGGATIGVATAEVVTRTVPIPGGLMGENGQLEVTFLNSHLNSATAKTTRAKFGGGTVTSQAPTTTATLIGRATLANITNGVQMSPGNFVVGASASANFRSAVDTTVGQDYTLTLQMAAATDYIINHSFRLDLYKV